MMTQIKSDSGKFAKLVKDAKVTILRFEKGSSHFAAEVPIP